MKAVFAPSRPTGEVTAPPSKSIAHRYLIAAALAEGVSHIDGIAASEDVSATIDCLRAIGAEITLDGSRATVRGFDPRKSSPVSPLVCRESGSTLRFLLPLCWLSGEEFTLRGSARLLERPLSLYEEIAAAEGLTLTRADGAVTASGRLGGGEYTLRGNVSSQFITGLIFALPFTARDSVLRLLPPVESRSYLDLTLDALARFGGKADFIDDVTVAIPAGTQLQAADLLVEGDHSNAAFFLALKALGCPVTTLGILDDSRQGDRVAGAHLLALCEGYATISLADCPDLGPILMAVAAAKHGAHFTDTRRLRIKESDRGIAMAEELAKLGAHIKVEENDIYVEATPLHAPSEPLCGHNDHRIVMASATLLALLGGSITGAEAVKKSLPEYFAIMQSLGTEVTLYENE